MLSTPQMDLKLPQGHEGSEYVLSFEIGQREGGFYGGRTDRQTGLPSTVLVYECKSCWNHLPSENVHKLRKNVQYKYLLNYTLLTRLLLTKCVRNTLVVTVFQFDWPPCIVINTLVVPSFSLTDHRIWTKAVQIDTPFLIANGHDCFRQNCFISTPTKFWWKFSHFVSTKLFASTTFTSEKFKFKKDFRLISLFLF